MKTKKQLEDYIKKNIQYDALDATVCPHCNKTIDDKRYSIEFADDFAEHICVFLGFNNIVLKEHVLDCIVDYEEENEPGDKAEDARCLARTIWETIFLVGG